MKTRSSVNQPPKTIVVERETRRRRNISASPIKRCVSASLFLLILLSVSAASADPFSQGMIRTSLSVGWGRAFDQNYFVWGLGSGIYVFDGLELGVDGEFWLGGSPTIYKAGPMLRYVLDLDSPVKPYAGVFYRHTFVSFRDLDSVGYRIGAYYTSGEYTFLGIGLVYERFFDKDSSHPTSVTQTYPEITLSTSF